MAFISILVRARNDEAIIGRTLEGIFAQKIDIPFEVVVCDDASTDRTKDVAAQFPVRFFTRPEGKYKPGRTLNALVKDARGDLLVFNNSDAVPLDEHWLAELVKPLVSEPDKAAFAFANQLPRKDATALVRKDSERAFGDGKIHATWRFFFSLASSATWKKLLVETPFDEDIQFSEDVEWTWRNSRRQQNPVSIVYCPDSHVEHSHNYTLKQLARRFKGEGMADRVIFGDKPSLLREVAGAAKETLRDWAYLLKRPGNWLEVFASPVRRLVQRISHWSGVREADKGM
ncbi:MAG: glycosyltransferase family 2 protein, partial [Victivallales bacterium]|nr:glycosyltransferase family 2 protein [Victivallales bacterium]